MYLLRYTFLKNNFDEFYSQKMSTPPEFQPVDREPIGLL